MRIELGLALFLIVFIVSCSDPGTIEYKKVKMDWCAGTKTDTAHFSFDSLNYSLLCHELFIGSYLPEDDELRGAPGSYVENICETPNFSKKDYEDMLRNTGGKLFLDTTDRDFTKFWYDDRGFLKRYEIKNFGDIYHTECILTFTQQGSLEQLEIYNVVMDSIKCPLRTIKIETNGMVTDLTHNVVK